MTFPVTEHVNDFASIEGLEPTFRIEENEFALWILLDKYKNGDETLVKLVKDHINSRIEYRKSGGYVIKGNNNHPGPFYHIEHNDKNVYLGKCPGCDAYISYICDWQEEREISCSD